MRGTHGGPDSGATTSSQWRSDASCPRTAQRCARSGRGRWADFTTRRRRQPNRATARRTSVIKMPGRQRAKRAVLGGSRSSERVDGLPSPVAGRPPTQRREKGRVASGTSVGANRLSALVSPSAGSNLSLVHSPARAPVTQEGLRTFGAKRAETGLCGCNGYLALERDISVSTPSLLSRATPTRTKRGS